MVVVSQWGDAVVFDLQYVKATTEDSDIYYVRVNGLLFGRYDTWEDAKEVVVQAMRAYKWGNEEFKLPRENEVEYKYESD